MDDIQLPEPGTHWGPNARFEIVKRLGSGSSATVFEAVDHLSEGGEAERHVALKLLKPWLSEKAANWDEIVAGFRREAETLKSLSHAHIPECFELGEFDGIHWMACELVKGKPLPEWNRKMERGPELAVFLLPIASGLHHAHRRGFVHGDVSPHNLVVKEFKDETYAVMLVDWGSVYRTGDPPPTVVRGTPGYMAPEAAFTYRGGITPDSRDDQFSLAALGARVVLGLPWDAPLCAELLLEESGQARRFPVYMRKALVRALAPQRADRFPSIKEFAEEAFLPDVSSKGRQWFEVADDDPMPGRVSRETELELVSRSNPWKLSELTVSRRTQVRTVIVCAGVIAAIIIKYLLGE